VVWCGEENRGELRVRCSAQEGEAAKEYVLSEAAAVDCASNATPRPNRQTEETWPV